MPRPANAVDFWRGFALVSIFINHIPGNVFQNYTYSQYGISDAAELFVFLAGWSIGIATRGRDGVPEPAGRTVLRLLSRMVEELSVGDGYDAAIRRTFETTGKTVLFTGVSLTASIIFWVFFPMKFQAQMAFLLVVLLAFHLIGALMFIPPMVALLRPRFAAEQAAAQAERRQARELAETKRALGA